MPPVRRHQTRFFVATKRSNSEEIRKKGNIFYARAFQPGLAPIIAIDRLQRAINLYAEAFEVAGGEADSMSSAMKNSGLAHYRLAILSSNHLQGHRCAADEASLEGMEDETFGWFQRAFVKFREAAKFGTGVKGGDWLTSINEKIQEMYDKLLVFLRGFNNFDRRIGKLYQIARVVFEGKLLCILFHQTADMLFKKAVMHVDGKDFRMSLKCLHEMNFPIEEGLKYCPENFHLAEDLRVLQQDSVYQLATAESVQANASAKEQLDALLLDEEFLEMEIVWDVLDLFKAAALKAREMDIEQEAIAVFYQGVIYHDIFKLKQKAKSFFRQVLFLCEAAKPRFFFLEEWFIRCNKYLKELQDQERGRDEDEQQKKKRHLLEKLKPKLEAIRKLEGGGGESHMLLKHIYKHHKPKAANRKLSKADVKTLKKLETTGMGEYNPKKAKQRKMMLLKALQDYHPDRNHNFGKKWEVLCEEICKSINFFYERIKLSS